jgi:hypothetical protein
VADGILEAEAFLGCLDTTSKPPGEHNAEKALQLLDLP